MRAAVAALAAAFIIIVAPTVVAAQAPSDPPGLTCVTWQNQWRRAGAAMTLAEAQAFLSQFTQRAPTCAGTRAAARARIDALSRSTTLPPADPCASANAAWPYLCRSTDRRALQDFINEAPARCSVRREAQTRLEGLPRETVTRPPPAETRAPVQQPTQTPPQATQTFRDCPECPEMVRIPGGTFTMGSPASETGRADDETQRSVTVAAFAAGRYEVTFAQWDACVAAGGCNDSGPRAAGGDNGWGRGSRPVVEVSWNDAQTYVEWLSQRTGRRYRLLAEAEWEYAARAGTTTRFSWGDQDPVCDQSAPNGANFSACTDDRTRPVGSFQPNRFGLYDMHGNVWEWVEDCYANDCSSRVLRGGSWSIIPQGLHSAYRDWFSPSLRFFIIGFRVARTV